MGKYRKKSTVIEAEQWYGPGCFIQGLIPYSCIIIKDLPCQVCGSSLKKAHMFLETSGSSYIICPDDWIITEASGKKYSCTPKEFKQTYEKI